MPPKSQFLSSLKSPKAVNTRQVKATVSKKTPIKASSVYKKLVSDLPTPRIVKKTAYADESDDSDDDAFAPLTGLNDDSESEDEPVSKSVNDSIASDPRFSKALMSVSALGLTEEDEVRFDDHSEDEGVTGEVDTEEGIEEDADDAEEDAEVDAEMDGEEDAEEDAEQDAEEDVEEDVEEDAEEDIEEDADEAALLISPTSASRTSAQDVAASTAMRKAALQDGSDDDDEDAALLDLDTDASATQTASQPEAAPEPAKPAAAGLDIHSAKAKRKAEKYLAKQLQRGVCFISRVPPQMGPKRLRLMLSDFGELGRVFLEPEDVVKTLKRKRAHGGGGKRYVGGWVEFMDKRKAKRAALLLHGHPMGYKKRDKFANDLWQIKYMSGLKWEDLRQQHLHEREMREAALRTEISQAKREASEYADNVEAAERRQRMVAAKARRGEVSSEVHAQRAFRQRQSMVRTRDVEDE